MSLRFVTSGGTKMTVPGGKNVIYGNVANINYFIKTALVPDTVDGIENRESTVKSSKRRKYASDTEPVNVSGHSRQWLYDPGRRNGSALPGHPFILDDGTEKRSFFYTGDFIDLHAFFTGEAKKTMVLYSQSAAYDIIVEEAGGD